ncbi:MAG: cupin domain-containing protein [Candidatus Marinimicrobia bacterium]|jgi:mannose-6-phosphate isomerase-like protein (cupin superfamily)|nr:cupin domain-containing protein [Candidatus Neomarinimicrobiota bacterium]MDP6992451.1 cupin domain-containing protein [Candidatus Neomarinimicrobiota bacterium]
MNYTKQTYDFENLNPWLTFLRDDLDLKGVAMGLARIPEGKGYTFMHQHEEQEEVYVVIMGRGIMYVDGEILNMYPGDIIKVDPEGKRCIKADDDTELVCMIIGAVPAKGYPKKDVSKTLIDDGLPDWENLPPWYEGNEKIVEINKKIRAQREEGKS